MGYRDKEECCARLSSQVLDGIASSRLSGTLKKAVAFRAVELTLRGGPRPRAGHMEDEVAEWEHVKVPLLLSIDIKEEITEAVVENRTAEQIVDVPSPQCHEDIVEMTAVRSVGVAMTPTGAVKKMVQG